MPQFGCENTFLPLMELTAANASDNAQSVVRVVNDGQVG